MTGAHESFTSLRKAYRLSEYRRFRVKHRSNKWADILGFAPDGKTLLGWWDGSEQVEHFAPDDIAWAQLTTYV
jgi:hypothetical protein